jgi:predicted NAD-dependent protein-ADP-ribosyltransferase YbiA (DUF1768 family)
MRRGTFRNADGQRVEGVWRHIFTRNGDTYYLADLVIYADGAIDCRTGGLTDLDGLREQLRCGRVATTLEEGATASVHHVASCRFAQPQTWIDADMLLGEVADEIDRLNERPDSTDRCVLAVKTYLADPSEQHRLAVRDRYLAIPEHLRIYALGDMDRKDLPLRVLITDLGETVPWWPDDVVVTDETRAQAVEYFREQDHRVAEWQARVPADGPEQAQAPTLTLARTYYPKGFPADPGINVLQNDYPATITVNGRDYPTVIHAYWALSTTDAQLHDQIAHAPRAYDAQKLAEQAPRRPGWPAARLAVMAALLRVKYTQHPQLAQVLLDTGDARIIYTDLDSAYWVAGRKQGTNWIGRLLEVIRSELAAADAGIPLPATQDASPPASP